MIRSIEFRAMNTAVMLAAEGEGAIPGMYAAKAFIDECEQRFSRFLPASELSELNRSAGKWIHISDDLMDLLQLSMKYHRETNGLFDPSILPDLKHIGYDRSMDEIRANGTRVSAPGSERPPRPAFEEISVDFTDHRVRLPRGLEIDLGGIAKGWIVEKSAQLLHRYVDVCGVSAGGDILFIGRPLDGMDWDVYLEDPRSPTQTLAQLHIPSGAVATSSIMKRTWSQGQKVRHHLIDPRTGEPAETDWLSVTVITSSIIDAEVYAKAILIGGEKELSHLLKAGKDLTFISVNRDGNISGSPSYKEYMYELTSEPF
jgi:thiamine biosynthesis lipoprotein